MTKERKGGARDDDGETKRWMDSDDGKLSVAAMVCSVFREVKR